MTNMLQHRTTSIFRKDWFVVGLKEIFGKVSTILDVWMVNGVEWDMAESGNVEELWFKLIQLHPVKL
jgi:hypothetical protein